MQNGAFIKLYDYHPYRVHGEHNPRRDQITYKIMDLKSPGCANYETSVSFLGLAFLELFRKQFSHIPSVQIAIVPSSKVAKISDGLERIIKTIPWPPSVIYNRGFLVRTQNVHSSHEGGERSEQLHLQTISNIAALNPAIPCIIIDDVKTTGASLNACEKIIRQTGVSFVVKLAIGETV